MQRKTKLALLFLLLVACWVVAYRSNLDLAELHAAARLAYEGHLESLYDANAASVSAGVVHGPLSLLLIKPLGALPLAWVKWIWIALQTIGFAIFWVSLGRLYPVLRDTSLRWGWLLVWIVAINPIHGNFQGSHGLLMLAAALFFAELLAQNDHPLPQTLGGAIAAIAGGIQVFPLFIAAYYLFTRPRATRRGVVLGLLLSVGLPYLAFGTTDATALFRAFGREFVAYGTLVPTAAAPEVLCLPSMLARWLSDSNEPLSSTATWSIRFASFAVGGIFLLVAAKAARAKYLRVERADTHWWALAMALCAFLNPSTRPHAFLFFVPAFCSLLEFTYLRLSSALLTLGTIVSAVLIALTTAGLWGRQINNELESWSVPTLGVALLCAALALGLARRKVLYVR